jgi:WD40 repeat protein
MFDVRCSVFTLLRMLRLCSLLLLSCAALADGAPSKDYSSVDAIFTKHCLDCHAAKDPEGQLVLETFETLMKGGELGAAVNPGNSADSLLVRMIEGRFEKEGKKKIMPPGKREKLSPAEISTLRGWIDSGAQPSSNAPIAKVLTVPKIQLTFSPRNPINALAWSAPAGLLAVARYAEVELRSPSTLQVVRALPGHEGNVNALAFSSDGKELYAAAGQPGWAGEVRRWNVSDGKLLTVLQGHKDAVYSLALSPDGNTLATGSYDQKIKLWDLQSGKELKTLSGHNGCIYDLSFRPDGKILASASADRTVKLWDPQSGERRETLAQSLKEVFAVAFSPDGKHLFAGGADNRVRVWAISENAAETTNPILHSKFAHEGAILRLVVSADGKNLLSSADDRTVKLWDASELRERLLLEKQTDWPPAAAFLPDSKVVVGRLDGSMSLYDVGSGKALASVGGYNSASKDGILPVPGDGSKVARNKGPLPR